MFQKVELLAATAVRAFIRILHVPAEIRNAHLPS
jgi:hypothetical protein